MDTHEVVIGTYVLGSTSQAEIDYVAELNDVVRNSDLDTLREFVARRNTDAVLRSADLTMTLAVALVECKFDMCVFLVENVNVDTNDTYGYLVKTALEYQRVDILRFLVERTNVNVFTPSPSGTNLLHRAVTRGAHDIVRYLVEEVNMSLSSRDSYDHTALDICAFGEANEAGSKLELVRYLVRAGAPTTNFEKHSWISVAGDGTQNFRFICTPHFRFICTQAREFQFEVATTTYLRAVNTAFLLTRDVYLVSRFARALWTSSTLIGRNLPSSINERMADRIALYALDRRRRLDNIESFMEICQ